MSSEIKECFDAILEQTQKLSQLITEPDELTAVNKLELDVNECQRVFEHTKNLNGSNSNWNQKKSFFDMDEKGSVHK